MGAPGPGALQFIGAAPGGTANYKQTDNTSAMGGDPDTIQLVDANADLLFDSSPGNPAGGADVKETNIFYRQNAEGAGGKCQDIRNYWPNALRDNPGGGPLSITATAADAGKFLRILAEVGGVFVDPPELVPLINGTSTAVTNPDAGQLWRAEVCDSTSTSIAPVASSAAGPIGISQAGTDCGQVPEPRTNRNGGTVTFKCATKEFEMAIATSKNTALSSANRLTDPTGIGSYSIPIVTGTTDTSLAAPDLDDGDYYGVAIRKTKRAGLAGTVAGDLSLAHDAFFTAVP